MLVRLLRPGHFMLVCDRIIAVYHLSTDGNWEQANSSPLYRPDTEDGTFRPSNQGVSPSVPCWTNWARPTRRPGWRNEVIYLAREDGSLRYVELRSAHKNQLRIHSTDDAGQLNSSIDSAFAVLDVEQNRLEDGVLPNDALDGKFAQGYPDVFLVVGDLSDGGIFEVSPSWITAYTELTKHQRSESEMALSTSIGRTIPPRSPERWRTCLSNAID